MATQENILYWRLFLYLHDGVQYLSRYILDRVAEKDDKDLQSLLIENERKLKKMARLDQAENDVLFPEDGKTDLHNWSPNLYITVILTIFPASLKQEERIQIKNIKHILSDLCKNLEESSLDDLSYEDHMKGFQDAIDVLAFDEHSRKKIVHMRKTYIEEQLDSPTVLERSKQLNFSTEARQNWLHFLEAFTSAKQCHEIQEEEYASDTETASRDDDNANDAKDTATASRDDDNANDAKDAEIPSRDDDTSNDAKDAETSNKDVDNSSDAIAVEMRDIEAASREAGQMEDIEAASDEIVSVATMPQADKERKFLEHHFNKAALEKTIQEKAFKSHSKETLNSWEKEPVNLAILGRSGVGKSRLINAIRGIKSHNDPLYAPIGVVETTSEAKAYAHPKNALLKLWDMPGIGTKTFRKKDYFKDKRINFYSYDIYVIVCADRFTEEDEDFAAKLEKVGKTFLFVRTKADISIDECDESESVDVLQTIRHDCVQNLSSTKIKADDVYLISSKNVDHPLLDFPKFVNRLVLSLPDLKKEAIINSLRFNTKELIERKIINEKKYATAICVASAFGGSMPIPGLSFMIDYQLICCTVKNFQTNLGVTEDDLKNLAEKTGKPVDTLKSKYKLKSFMADITKMSTLLPLISKIAMSEVAESTVKLLPVVGSAIGAGLSSYSTYRLLTANLEIIGEDARKMLDILLEETGKGIMQMS